MSRPCSSGPCGALVPGERWGPETCPLLRPVQRGVGVVPSQGGLEKTEGLHSREELWVGWRGGAKQAGYAHTIPQLRSGVLAAWLKWPSGPWLWCRLDWMSWGPGLPATPLS